MNNPARAALRKNITFYRWSRFLRNLIFWQSIWFLYYQDILSATDAILLYALTDIATTVLEVPSGYMSDRLGRRVTLIAGGVAGLLAAVLLVFGTTFAVFAVATMLFGASLAFSSGTEEAILYESLSALERADEVEHQEIIAWRYSFAALALSAVSGGALAMVDMKLAYIAVVFSFAGHIWVTWQMVEPPHETLNFAGGGQYSETQRWHDIIVQTKHPVLMWFFALSVCLYAFSHLPFVFGQPFILTTLQTMNLAPSAPLISGIVSATMMAVSVIVSLVAARLRRSIGLPALLLGAFFLQVAITGAMALSDSVWILLALMLRMVPDALSRPFILGRVQPLLSDTNRATWLSLQSFTAKLIFASALGVSAISTTNVGAMPFDEIQTVLSAATLLGLVCLALLAITARKVAVEAP